MRARGERVRKNRERAVLRPSRVAEERERVVEEVVVISVSSSSFPIVDRSESDGRPDLPER